MRQKLALRRSRWTDSLGCFELCFACCGREAICAHMWRHGRCTLAARRFVALRGCARLAESAVGVPRSTVTASYAPLFF
eukprot:1646136-Prymnesium_polylepis.1